MKLSQIAFYGLKTWKYVPFGREALDEDRRDVKAWKAGSDCWSRSWLSATDTVNSISVSNHDDPFVDLQYCSCTTEPTYDRHRITICLKRYHGHLPHHTLLVLSLSAYWGVLIADSVIYGDYNETEFFLPIIYRITDDFVRTSEFYFWGHSSQKYHMDVGLVLNGYGAADI